jgi:Tfp pilus assembly protein PilF
VLYKQGKFQEAAKQFDMILETPGRTRTDSSVVYDHAGDAAWRVGNARKAGELWAQALEKAKKEKPQVRDVKKVLVSAAAKLEALKQNKEPVTAPLGQGVTATDGK